MNERSTTLSLLLRFLFSLYDIFPISFCRLHFTMPRARELVDYTDVTRLGVNKKLALGSEAV